jgi:hypothetical protein
MLKAQGLNEDNPAIQKADSKGVFHNTSARKFTDPEVNNTCVGALNLTPLIFSILIIRGSITAFHWCFGLDFLTAMV